MTSKIAHTRADIILARILTDRHTEPLRRLEPGEWMSILLDILEPLDMVAWLGEKHRWSLATFGPGLRTEGVIDHIEKEFKEIRQAVAAGRPLDAGKEWCDVILLAFDGALRTGMTPREVLAYLSAKQYANEHVRKWPPLSEQREDKGTEHIRDADT